MKRWALLLGAILLFPVGASAQEESPKAEIFAGYSYGRLSASGLPGFDMNGGSASVSLNATSKFGVVADFGGYHVDRIGGVPVDGNIYSYLFGPKLAYRSGRFTAFAQALFGGAHATESAFMNPQSDNAFAMALGGGLDANATSHISVRFIQAEYFMTRFFSETQNNARFSAGVVFRF